MLSLKNQTSSWRAGENRQSIKLTYLFRLRESLLMWLFTEPSIPISQQYKTSTCGNQKREDDDCDDGIYIYFGCNFGNYQQAHYENTGDRHPAGVKYI